jgi:hypothetical protein
MATLPIQFPLDIDLILSHLDFLDSWLCLHGNIAPSQLFFTWQRRNCQTETPTLNVLQRFK